MTCIKILIGSALIVCCAAGASAQQRNPINDLLGGYERGDYQQVAALAESLAADTAGLNRSV